MTADVCCHITVIRRLILYVMSYNCYHTSDVWFYMLCYITVIRGLITVIWCQTSTNSYITVVSRRLMLYVMSDVWCYTTVVIGRLMSHICCHILSVIRCLMPNIRRLITVIWCQTSDNSYMTADVCCHIAVITRLMSDFIFYVT